MFYNWKDSSFHELFVEYNTKDDKPTLVQCSVEKGRLGPIVLVSSCSRKYCNKLAKPSSLETGRPASSGLAEGKTVGRWNCSLIKIAVLKVLY